MKEKICCICKKKYTGWGNNAYPVVMTKDPLKGRCCDECNALKVIPARIEETKSWGKPSKKIK